MFFQDRQIGSRVIVDDGFIFLLGQDADLLAQNIDTLHFAGKAVRGLYGVADAGKLPVQVLIRVGFVFQTAHQPSAGAGNLRRVQGQILLLRHLDGDGDEIRHIRAAAERPSADADAAEHLCLIAHADLAQLDPGFEDGCEILDQTPEIDAAVGREIKQDLFAVKRVLRADQLHVEAVFTDLFLADGECGARFFLIFPHTLQILPGRGADHFLQRLDDLFVVQRGRTHHNAAALDSPRRLDDDVRADVDIRRFRLKVVKLSGRPEPHSDNICHVSSP